MMNRKLLFVIFVLVAILVFTEGGRRRRRRRNCPRTDEESNGDHWCCDVKSWNETRTRLIWWPCDEAENTDNVDRRRRSSEPHNWWENYCAYVITFNVTVYYNSWDCCEGWNLDDYGDCSISDGDTTPVYCENGGTVVDSIYCACPEGFTGTHCETPICTPACLNNGHCGARDGRPICICPSHFTGDQCQIPVCEKPCKNGGTCVADVCETRCECPAGYVGRFCEIAIKEGDCPVANDYGTCYDSCHYDQDCYGSSKCCYNGCGHECMKPINSSRCVYKNHTYNVGEVMHKDDCTTCTCRGEGMSHDPSGFDCFTIACFITSCPNATFYYKKIPGQCCGTCEEIRCPNGCGAGTCYNVYGVPKCICPHNFRGDSCEIPVCRCQNGGTCRAQGNSTYCACDPAYTGKYCETRSADKAGVCPQNDGQRSNGSSCTSDWHCAGAEKCCSSSVGHVCVPPLNPEICIHQNMTYTVGSQIRKGSCMVCTCMGQGNTRDLSGFSCRPTPCPVMAMGCPPGTVYQTPPGECCAKCVELHCQQNCQHGGHCSLVNGSTTCICPENFAGEFCDIAVCPSTCQNGGQCVANGDYGVMCACAVGFSGKYCETKLEDKKGLCPYKKGNMGICVQMCSHDLQCRGDDKCCFTGCGHDCVPALNPDICKVGDVTYRKGEELHKSACEKCVCKGQGHGDDPSGFSCSVMMCAMPMCAPGFVIKTLEGQCCPTCVEPQLPLPKFKWCPSKVTIDVNSYDRFVDLKHTLLPKLVAVDGTGHILPVSLSLSQLEHCACPHSQQNIHNVVATSTADKYGRIASCAMAVIVKDVHPPKFTSCPSNFELFTTDVVAWDKPTVADNVGLHRIDFLGTQRNNTRFVSGSYMLGYIATDFEGNVAVCQFKVSVWEEDSTDISMPHEMKKIQEDDVKSNRMFIGIGVAIGALVTLAVVIVLFICCRKSAAARNASARCSTRSPVSLQQGYDNGIYAIYGTPPPDYEVPGKGKLPEYSTSEPPDYESVDPFPRESKGMENPAYVSTIDVKLDLDNKVNETLGEQSS